MLLPSCFSGALLLLLLLVVAVTVGPLVVNVDASVTAAPFLATPSKLGAVTKTTTRSPSSSCSSSNTGSTFLACARACARTSLSPTRTVIRARRRRRRNKNDVAIRGGLGGYPIITTTTRCDATTCRKKAAVKRKEGVVGHGDVRKAVTAGLITGCKHDSSCFLSPSLLRSSRCSTLLPTKAVKKLSCTVRCRPFCHVVNHSSNNSYRRDAWKGNIFVMGRRGGRIHEDHAAVTLYQRCLVHLAMTIKSSSNGEGSSDHDTSRDNNDDDDSQIRTQDRFNGGRRKEMVNELLGMALTRSMRTLSLQQESSGTTLHKNQPGESVPTAVNDLLEVVNERIAASISSSFSFTQGDASSPLSDVQEDHDETHEEEDEDGMEDVVDSTLEQHFAKSSTAQQNEGSAEMQNGGTIDDNGSTSNVVRYNPATTEYNKQDDNNEWSSSCPGSKSQDTVKVEPLLHVAIGRAMNTLTAPDSLFPISSSIDNNEKEGENGSK